uniref:F-box domain-containing protein n=1 Tax=Mycena chlorophos TaxID=658473 RepID=A0ABQ0LZE3_MYCCL|nr:predicted protein [Mycena chlorophos]
MKASRREASPDAFFLPPPPMPLLDFAPELLIRILALADADSIRACAQTCVALRSIVQSSSALQYIVECDAAGVVDGSRSSLVAVVERLRALASRQSRLSRLEPSWRSTVAVPFSAGLGELSGGFYCLGEAQAIHVLQLPTHADERSLWRNMRVPKRYGVLVDLNLSASQDVVVLATHCQAEPYRITLIPYSISTFQLHPLAVAPIPLIFKDPRMETPSIKMEIVGELIVCVVTEHFSAVLGGPELHGGKDYIFVYSWKTGALLKKIVAAPRTYHGFTFLTPETVLLVNLRNRSLEFWDVFGPFSKTPRLTLLLPYVRPGFRLLGGLCRCQPSPSVAFDVAGDTFASDPTTAIVHFQLTFASPKTLSSFMVYLLFIHRHSLLDLLRKHATKVPIVGPHALPYTAWGPPVCRWLLTANNVTNTITSGQRCVLLKQRQIGILDFDVRPVHLRQRASYLAVAKNARGGWSRSPEPELLADDARLFAQPVYGRLPYFVHYIPTERKYTLASMDNVRVIATWDHLGTETIDIMYFDASLPPELSLLPPPPSMYLLDIAAELLIRILSSADGDAIHACEQVCVDLRSIIQSSSILQYIVERDAAGVVDEQQRSLVPVPERLSGLQARQRGLARMKSSWTCTSRFYGRFGNYRLILDGSFYAVLQRRGVRISPLPVRRDQTHIGTSLSTRNPILGFGLSAAENLAIIATRDEETAPCIQLNAYQLTTLHGHPLALTPVTLLVRPQMLVGQFSLTINIVADIVICLLCCESLGDPRGQDRIFINSWETGTLLKEIVAAPNTYKGVVFVTQDIALLVNGQEGSFEFWDILTPDSTPLLSLQLPYLRTSCSFNIGRCQCAPNPWGPGASGTPVDAFASDPRSAIACFHIGISSPGPNISYLLYIHRHSLLNLLQQHTTASSVMGPHALPYSAWGGPVCRWIPCQDPIDDLKSTSYGQRSTMSLPVYGFKQAQIHIIDFDVRPAHLRQRAQCLADDPVRAKAWSMSSASASDWVEDKQAVFTKPVRGSLPFSVCRVSTTENYEQICLAEEKIVGIRVQDFGDEQRRREEDVIDVMHFGP